MNNDNYDEIIIESGIPIPPLHLKTSNWENKPITRALRKLEIGQSFTLPEKQIKSSDLPELQRRLGIKVTMRRLKDAEGKLTGIVRIWRVEGVIGPKKTTPNAERIAALEKTKSWLEKQVGGYNPRVHKSKRLEGHSQTLAEVSEALAELSKTEPKEPKINITQKTENNEHRSSNEGN